MRSVESKIAKKHKLNPAIQSAKGNILMNADKAGIVHLSIFIFAMRVNTKSMLIAKFKMNIPVKK